MIPESPPQETGYIYPAGGLYNKKQRIKTLSVQLFFLLQGKKLQLRRSPQVAKPFRHSHGNY
jgi:hypothetical protein